MKFTKVFVALCLVLLVCSASTMKNNHKEGLYIVGVSASFTDSLIYFSDVQFVDSAMLENKMLKYRNQYSEQMANYLTNELGLQNRTCFVYFNKKKHKLEKMIKKMKAKYQKEGKSILRETGADFKFTKAVAY